MKPAVAFTGLSVQLMTVIDPDRSDGRKIMESNAG